mmetsp:Transcript_13761/g.11703  ORF Transcript_13761/g.11703 Transcript_13761/m.11703 type:complete len:203 (+) Transcript_13761:68-676(+)
MTYACPNTTNYAYMKDDSNVPERWAYVLNFAASAVLLGTNLYHINKLMQLKNSTKRLKLINIFLFITLFCQTLYFMDGFIALFNSIGYLSLEPYYFLYFTLVCLYNLTLTISYYNWIPLIAKDYSKRINNFQKAADFVAYGFLTIFVCCWFFIVIQFVLKDICAMIDANMVEISSALLVMTCTSAVNSIVFAIICYTLAKKL